jgi:peptidyl-dipeptidase A
MNLDREGDVRVVCNIKDNQRWMGTMLHEYGHAVYDKNISSALPWPLREPAHIFVTEAIAMLFGRFAYMPVWLKDVIGIDEKEIKEIVQSSKKQLQLSQLVFTRWVQVIYRFEKAMYENPDQDLDELWWQLVEKYQKLQKPEGRNNPDWAAKIHIALYPAYYHNYMLGEMLASQVYFYISRKVLKKEKNGVHSFNNEKDAGQYLKHLYFSYGALYNWQDLIIKSTGEKLNPKYYADQFIHI